MTMGSAAVMGISLSAGVERAACDWRETPRKRGGEKEGGGGEGGGGERGGGVWPFSYKRIRRQNDDRFAAMDHEFRSAEERAPLSSLSRETETGIDEAMIEMLIRGFYARVRRGPSACADLRIAHSDWEPHLDNMFAFWSSLTLHTGRYHGQPMAKHMRLAVDARHFDRWLALFEETARDLCPPPRRSGSSSGRGASRRAWSLASRAPTVFCCSKGERYRREAEDHLSEKSVSSTLPLSPMMHTSVCGFVDFVRST